MIFVDYVRKYHEEQGYDELEKAINKAIDRCIEEGVLANFLMENRAEVVKVTQLDYTFDRQITLERKDAREEGKKEGKEEGKLEEILSSVREGDYSKERGAEKLGISVEEFEKLME